ncbi:MAG: site-2 protease family protein [Planctomycetota bacterium]
MAFAQDLDSTVLLVRPGSAAEKAGLQTGDQVTGLNGKPAAEWADIQLAAGNAATLESPLAFRRRARRSALELMATAGVGAALEYGFGYRPSMYTFRADGFGKAITLGARSSLRMLREAVMTLKQMFRREISPKNLGGIVTIGQVSYQASSMGWTKLLFFLCMLSVNLAFLNVLPIPLLDGGHLFFLMIEGIKGSPVSEKIMGYSQLVGLVLILSLMVYVTYQDILRLL